MDNEETQATTWYEAAEAEESEVKYDNYPLWVAVMAQAEQQKRTADALERIAKVAEHATAQYINATWPISFMDRKADS